jgi:Uncharacterized conserved protein (DUF2278)/Calcineurin-like phosphoesterase
MKLHSYGLLIGNITASRPKRPGMAHWLLMVQPKDSEHPPYRVAVNLESEAPRRTSEPQPTARGRKISELQYQIVDFSARGGTSAGDALIKKLRALGATQSFHAVDSEPSIPKLDFVRGGFIDPGKFVDLRAGSKTLLNAFRKTLAEARKSDGNSGALVAVFGTGYPTDPETGASVPTGFTGIENIHMNQGAKNLINHKPHYHENSPDQDGGIIFLLPTGAMGFFVKFHTQTTKTRPDGHPAETGIPQIDKTSLAVRQAIMPKPRRRVMAARRATGNMIAAPVAAPAAKGKSNPPATLNPQGFMFADFDPQDASGTFIPDDDGDTFNTPYVQQRSKGQTKGPVPTPRSYPRMDLGTVVGANPPGYVGNSSGKSLAFDVIGDSGAATEKNLNAFELKVTDLITRNAIASPPAFLYHVGDVVYFYGEENYFYSQFYEPFKGYPAPIFAIPGNHDGITYNDSMVSLESFQNAFCAEKPGRWVGSGAILRSQMTQPGVYFTLDTPLLSIIGLYSNIGESFGWLDEPQLLFLYQELVRLKKLRSGGMPAVILAIHHFPRWFPDQKPADPTSAAIDAACRKAGFWPDAVICGHAHLYQRVVRQDTGQDIPYVVTGAGGHVVSPAQEVGKSYMKQLDPHLGLTIFESGYVRATVTSPSRGDPTLRFEYNSVKPKGSGPDDVCEVNLKTNKLV